MPKQPKDAEILAALQTDPQTGLAQLLEVYGGLIRAVVRRVLPGQPQDAEECISDVLVSAWRNAGMLARCRRPLQGWLALTARNAAIDRWRSLKRSRTEELDEMLAGDWMLEPRTTDAEDLIRELVTALPQPDREIFLRRYYLMQPIREIAAAVKMQEHTVTVRLSRGRARLKQQFLERTGQGKNPKRGKERMQDAARCQQTSG